MLTSNTKRAVFPSAAGLTRRMLASFRSSVLKRATNSTASVSSAVFTALFTAIVSTTIFSIPSAFASSYDLFETGQV
ncbi:MAG: hypothetical protein LJE85_03290, partial [Gammaproteobacteria bacterium]|nr:hypothetical protein [Gammaproteobacteria bacterium]